MEYERFQVNFDKWRALEQGYVSQIVGSNWCIASLNLFI